jgi:hypothetical protein
MRGFRNCDMRRPRCMARCMLEREIAACATLSSSSGGRQRAGRRMGEQTETIVAYELSVRYSSSTVHLIGRGEV